MDDAHGLYGRFDTFLAESQAGNELVAVGQRSLEGHVQAGYHGVDALLVKFGETDADGGQKLMAGMLDVVLVICVVDDSLQVTFIVVDLHFQFKDIIREALEAFPRLKGVMLGRGLLADPSLPLAFREGELSEGELKRRVAEMHRLMYLYYYRVIEGGEAQLLAKLKTCWEYLLPDLDKKRRKAILKSNRLDGYLRAVEEALR